MIASASTHGSPRCMSTVSTVSMPRPENARGRRTAEQATSRRSLRRPVRRLRTTPSGSQVRVRDARIAARVMATGAEEVRTIRAVDPVRRALA